MIAEQDCRPSGSGPSLGGDVGVRSIPIDGGAAAGRAAGVGAWIGLATGPRHVGVLAMLQAGVNVAAPALVVRSL